MRYSYFDLKEQSKDTSVVVRLAGSSANVILLDRTNFASYRAGRPFLYEGGFRRRSPVRLTVPEDGHWYVVVDLGGYRGRVRAHVEVVGQDVEEEHGVRRARTRKQPAGTARAREVVRR